MDDEDDNEDAKLTLDEGEAEYAFEGFQVEFNERVTLTPPPRG